MQVLPVKIRVLIEDRTNHSYLST